MDFGQIMFLYGSPAMAVLICILNLAEIILISKGLKRGGTGRQRRHPVPMIFLMNLAVSDFSVGVVVIAVKILYFLLLHKVIPVTKQSLAAYHVLLFVFLRLSLLCSVFNLMALTLDRFFTIRNPLKYRAVASKRKALVVSVMTWVLSTILVAIHYYVSFYTSQKAWMYELIIFPATILPSSIVFVICYVCILRRIFIQGKEIKRLMSDGTSSARVASHVFKRENKVSQLAATVVCVFILCWMPVAISGLITICGVYIKPLILNPIFVLAFTNSVIDPLVYFGFKKRVAKKFRGFLTSLVTMRRNRSNEARRSTAVFSLSSFSRTSTGVQNADRAATNRGLELDAICPANRENSSMKRQ